MLLGDVDATPKNGTDSPGAQSDHLDTETFTHFAPLLDATHAYAQISGYRFRSSSFDGLREKLESDSATAVERYVGTSENNDYPRWVAKLQAEPQVRCFQERLQSNEPDPELLADLEIASCEAAAECSRNGMIALCRELDFWPPAPAPKDVSPNDCSYADMSAPVPVVAQRLYNDDLQRRRCRNAGGQVTPCRRAATAAFLLDFASETGVKLPPFPERYTTMLSEFAQKASAFKENGAETLALATNAKDPVLTEYWLSNMTLAWTQKIAGNCVLRDKGNG